MAMTRSAELVKTADRLCELARCEEAIALWVEASALEPSNPEIQYQLGLCYSRDCHAHGLRDHQIAAYHYSRALSLTERGNSLARAMLLDDLGNNYLFFPLPSRVRLLASIDCFERAARIYREAGKLDDWARNQYNIGNAWCEMMEAEFPLKWELAIAHFEQALSIRTREKDPGRQAATLQNLGTACRELKTGNRAANTRRAIHYYHQALRALREPTTSRRRADLHHNLGNAYLTLAVEGEDRVRNALRAIRHLTRALTPRAKIESPFDYAATQLSRGEAFLQLVITGADADSGLAQAHGCFQEAMDGFTQTGQGELADTAQRRLDLIARIPAEEATGVCMM